MPWPLNLHPALVALLAISPLGWGVAEESARSETTLPSHVRIAAGTIERQVDPGDPKQQIWIAEGNAEFSGDQAHIYADRIEFHSKTQLLVASGNVALLFPGASLAGSKLTYHVDDRTGELLDVFGWLTEASALLRADRVEKLGDVRIRVHGATFTTCTQPTPYWSFKISRGTFDLGQYAYMSNVRFKIRSAPVFYTPYLVYPIKTGRVSGLLFPVFGNSNKLGFSGALPLYIAIRPNVDLTLTATAYSKVGVALASQFEWLPTWNGRAWGQTNWIDDRIRHQNRYWYEWRQKQPLPFGFKLVAHIEGVSDFDYFTDYETDLQRASRPETRSEVDITRLWSWYSLSVRMRRQEQFFATGVGNGAFLTSKTENTLLPEVELRGRSQRIGHSPFYFSFVGSLDQFGRRVKLPPEGQSVVFSEDDLRLASSSRWWRADLAPAIKAPVLRQTWGDLEFNFGWRGTWYSAQRDPSNPDATISQSFSRSLLSAGLTFSGPRVQRVYLTPHWEFSPKLKHVIEPFLNYTFRPKRNSQASRIVRVDQIDDDPSSLSDVTYGVRQRFFALRPPSIGPGLGLASAKQTSFLALEREQKEAEERQKQREQLAALGANALVEPEEATAANVAPTPIELGSIEISQRYSFVNNLSTRYGRIVDPDSGVPLTDPLTGRPLARAIGAAHYSPISIRMRFNPTLDQAVDVAYTFDPANRLLTETQVSALMRLTPLAYLQSSWYRRLPANPQFADESSFLRLRAGWKAASQRIGIENDWDYDLRGGSLDHQAYTIHYATQCCAFRFTYDRRDFDQNSQQQYYLTVDLSGLGRIIDVSQQY